MDAPDVIRQRAWPPSEQVVVARLASTIALAGLATAAALALWFCLRRTSGALVSPLSTLQLFGCGVLLALAALGFRAPFFRRSAERPDPRVWILWCIVSAAGLLLAAALSLAESSAGGLVSLWGWLLLGEGWSWGRLWQVQITRVADPVLPAPARVPGTIAPPPPSSSTVVMDAALAAAASSPVRSAGLLEVLDPGQVPDDLAEVDESIVQQLTRRRTLEGEESLAGWLRVELAAGRRHATAHVAICPPLPAVPQCFAEAVDGPSVQIKVGLVQRYGVRFEIRLEELADEPQNVAIEFAIQPSAETSPETLGAE